MVAADLEQEGDLMKPFENDRANKAISYFQGDSGEAAVMGGKDR